MRSYSDSPLYLIHALFLQIVVAQHVELSGTSDDHKKKSHVLLGPPGEQQPIVPGGSFQTSPSGSSLIRVLLNCF